MRRIGDRRGASRSGKAGVHEGCLDRGADAAFLESLTPEPGKTLCAICVGVARISARAWSPRRLGTAGSGRVAATAYLDTHGSIVDVRLTAHDEGGGVLGAWRCAPSPQRRAALVEIGARASRFCANDDSTTGALDLDAGSHRARGGAPPGTLDPAMPPKKKGNGEDEAEACPADMDPEVWAVVKDVNQLVALASKKTSAPPVTRFDALLHLWSAAASNPRERDALVAAGALAASLAASKPDVPFLDRGAGLGLTRALTVGDERTSISSAAHLEAASEARVAASALEALLRGSSTSTRCVADALAILLGLARHASTRQRTIATIAASGARAWIALADALTLDERHETVAAADASRDAASLMSLCARFGDASADADAAAVDAAGSAIASVLATRTNALEHLLDAVCGAESELQSLKKKREDGDEDEDEDDEDERSVTSRGAEPPPAHLSALALERSRSIQLRRADKRLAAAECLALCSRSDDAGDWLFRGFQTPRVARLVRFMRRGHFVLRNVLRNPTSENLSDDAQRRFVTEVIEEEPFRNAAATALFNAVDRGACARADLALRRALAEDAALRAEAVSEETDGETDGEKNKKKPMSRISNPPLDLRREKLPGGFGQAARRSLADRRSATADGGPITHTGADASGADSRIVASRSGVAKMERARALCDAGGVAPLVALLLEKEKPKKGREGVTDERKRESSEKEKKSPEEKRREALKQALTLEGRRSAAGLTRYLTALDARTTSLVIAAGGVRAAVAALADADDDTRRHAQAALWNVANVEMEETNDAGDGEEAEAKKKTAVPRAHAEALRDANAPGYVSKVMAYGDQLEKLALRDASDNRCPDRPDASK